MGRSFFNARFNGFGSLRAWGRPKASRMQDGVIQANFWPKQQTIICSATWWTCQLNVCHGPVIWILTRCDVHVRHKFYDLVRCDLMINDLSMHSIRYVWSITRLRTPTDVNSRLINRWSIPFDVICCWWISSLTIHCYLGIYWKRIWFVKKVILYTEKKCFDRPQRVMFWGQQTARGHSENSWLAF